MPSTLTAFRRLNSVLLLYAAREAADGTASASPLALRAAEVAVWGSLLGAKWGSFCFRLEYVSLGVPCHWYF
jgi:hypothetical protein